MTKAFAHLERTRQGARVGQRRVDCSVSQAAVERGIPPLHCVQEVYGKCAVAWTDLDHVAKAGHVLRGPSRYWKKIQMRKGKGVGGRGVEGGEWKGRGTCSAVERREQLAGGQPGVCEAVVQLRSPRLKLGAAAHRSKRQRRDLMRETLSPEINAIVRLQRPSPARFSCQCPLCRSSRASCRTARRR